MERVVAAILALAGGAFAGSALASVSAGAEASGADASIVLSSRRFPAATTAEPLILELAGPIAQPRSEISGMTWMDDTLIILPQYPNLFAGSGELGFFTLPKDQILGAIDGTATGPLTPRQVACRAPGLSRIVQGFEGMEAVGLLGDRCYMTIEASDDTAMAGYLVSGRYDVVQREITIDMERLTAIPLGVNIPNIAEETLLIADGEIVTMSEANGRNVNPEPMAKRFSADLYYLGSLPLPSIEYRVTDATSPDREGRFWVVNYLYPPERAKLLPAADPEPPADPAAEFDPDACIERLLELRLVRSGNSGSPVGATDAGGDDSDGSPGRDRRDGGDDDGGDRRDDSDRGYDGDDSDGGYDGDDRGDGDDRDDTGHDGVSGGSGGGDDSEDGSADDAGGPGAGERGDLSSAGGYIERTETPPIYLNLRPDGRCRNWEAIVRLDDRGFLLMTDKYPETLLAFVPHDFSRSARN